jgi:hypothetical protein
VKAIRTEILQDPPMLIDMAVLLAAAAEVAVAVALIAMVVVPMSILSGGK